MKTLFVRGGIALSLLAALSLFAGCSGSPDPKSKGGQDKTQKDGNEDDEGHSSPDGWWCNEHGIPEHECSMCSAKVEKEAKAKGDWCDLHERAKSQCFLCDPTLKEKYAAKYRARYGKEPPLTDDEKAAKKEKKPEKKEK